MKCWNACKARVVTTVSGAPVCQECFDHYMGFDKPQCEKPEYITANVAVDLCGGASWLK